jgi:hypothetical protein
MDVVATRGPTITNRWAVFADDMLFTNTLAKEIGEGC